MEEETLGTQPYGWQGQWQPVRRRNLHLAVEMIGGRGEEYATPPSLSRDKAELATATMAGTVDKYFR